MMTCNDPAAAHRQERRHAGDRHRGEFFSAGRQRRARNPVIKSGAAALRKTILSLRTWPPGISQGRWGIVTRGVIGAPSQVRSSSCRSHGGGARRPRSGRARQRRSPEP